MKNFGAKIFKEKAKLRRLFLLAKKHKYSAPQLAEIFGCEKKTIHGVLNRRGIKLPNLGEFRKKYFCNEQFFITLNAASAYWAGFIAADGTIYSNNGKNKVLRIGLNKRDIDHLVKFKKAIKDKSKISYVKANESVSMSIRSAVIFDSLVKLGIVPKKSFKMEKVKVKEKFLSHFIRGLFDGDGCVSGNKITHLQFQLLGQKPLLKQMQKFLIKKCGVNKVHFYPAVYNKKCAILRLQYTGSQIFRILDFLYKNSTVQTRLDRKYRKYGKLKEKFQIR